MKLTNYDHRRNITKLRISAHPLEIEKGRYTIDRTTGTSIPLDNRVCRYCKIILQINRLEDENHALFDCPLYIKPRMKFTKCTTKSPIDILSTSTSILEASFVGKFVYDIFDTRQAFEDYINDSDDNVSH